MNEWAEALDKYELYEVHVLLMPIRWGHMPFAIEFTADDADRRIEQFWEEPTVKHILGHNDHPGEVEVRKLQLPGLHVLAQREVENADINERSP